MTRHTDVDKMQALLSRLCGAATTAATVAIVREDFLGQDVFRQTARGTHDSMLGMIESMAPMDATQRAVRPRVQRPAAACSRVARAA